MRIHGAFVLWLVLLAIVVSVLRDDPWRWNDERDLKDLRICFVGCAKNCDSRLRPTLERLMSLKAMFSPQSRIFVAENDSIDKTGEILRSFPEITVLDRRGLERYGKDLGIEREEILAILRNELLDVALKICGDFDFLINIDLDGFLDHLDLSDVAGVFRDRTRWDAVFANNGKHGKPDRYYDTYALRSKALGVEYCFLDARAHGHREDLSIVIPTTKPYIQVESAFNGMGIYRMSMISGCFYEGLAKECSVPRHLKRLPEGPCRRYICEHVPFNRCLYSKGARMFIATRLFVHQ